MKEKIYTLEEFLKKTGVDANRLGDWVQRKLVRPVGFTDEQAPFYSSRKRNISSNSNSSGTRPKKSRKSSRKSAFPGPGHPARNAGNRRRS
ncbi:MAG TPA: hypothetical protein ENN17_07860 [bacterium]|nr:hypothetical protein [bacterium]